MDFFLNIYIYVATESNSFWTWGGQSSQWKYRNWTRQQAFKFGPEQVSFIIKIYSTAWYMCFKKNKLEWRCVCGRDGGGGGGAVECGRRGKPPKRSTQDAPSSHPSDKEALQLKAGGSNPMNVWTNKKKWQKKKTIGSSQS